MAVLLFGGTTEGRLLAQWLQAEGLPATLCVATDYGEALAPAGGTLSVHVGRLDQTGMASMMQGYTCVVDATHPYAVQASRTIQAASSEVGLAYLRLDRPGAAEGAAWLPVPDAAQAAAAAQALPGRILLTTGSKDLHQFALPGLRERCVPRVLPALDSLKRCLDLGFPASQILCMQGPFTEALNHALIVQYQISVLITKDSGEAGGFMEKIAAARSTGCAVIVIDRPSTGPGMSLEQIKAYLKGELS